MLSYKHVVVYLGTIISDNGSTHNDINLHVADRNKLAYANQAPGKAKGLKSLEGSLFYGCETWSVNSLQKVETLYRNAIKLTLSMNVRTPTEIVYIESGRSQLNPKVYKRQYFFWELYLKENNDDGTTTVANIYKTANQTLYSKYPLLEALPNPT